MFSKIKKSAGSSSSSSSNKSGFSGIPYLPKLPKSSRIPYLSGISSRSKKKLGSAKSSACDNGCILMPRSLSFSNYKSDTKSEAIDIPKASGLFRTCGSVPSSYHRQDVQADSSPFFGSLPRMKNSALFFEPYTKCQQYRYRSETPISSSSLCSEITAFFGDKNLKNMDEDANDNKTETVAQTGYLSKNSSKKTDHYRSTTNLETSKLKHRSNSES
uniref:DUF4797 domain-containing protein n=1 Tax=Syphacia muris TaxID=451379 RepID=A0A0N5B085_9BILA